MPGSTARALQKTRRLGVPFGFQVIWFPELSSFLFGSLILERTSWPDCKVLVELVHAGVDIGAAQGKICARFSWVNKVRVSHNT